MIRPSPRMLVRHGIVTSCVAMLCFLLSRPEVVFFSRVGFVAWYPAIGLVMALAVGINPWYAIVAGLSILLADKMIYSQPLLSFGGVGDTVGFSICYGAAAYILRRPFQIDLGLRRRRDVFCYVLTGAAAASGATIIGVACLIADHGITSHEYKAAAISWFFGDAIGLVVIAPFLLVHVLPHVRRWLSHDSGLIKEKLNKKHAAFGSFLEACVQALAIVAVCWAMFRVRDAINGHFYMCFVPIIWIAMRHGVRRVVTGLLMLNAGIVVAMHLFPPTAAMFTQIGLFMLVIAATGLWWDLKSANATGWHLTSINKRLT